MVTYDWLVYAHQSTNNNWMIGWLRLTNATLTQPEQHSCTRLYPIVDMVTHETTTLVLRVCAHLLYLVSLSHHWPSTSDLSARPCDSLRRIGYPLEC